MFFFFNDTATTEIYTLSLHDALPILVHQSRQEGRLGSEVGELAAGALTFDQDELEAVLLPLDRLVTVPRSTTPRRLEAVVAEHGFSRYPVRDDDGALLGYLHVKDGPRSEEHTSELQSRQYLVCR